MRISLVKATLVAGVLSLALASLYAQGPSTPPGSTSPRAGGGSSVAVIDVGYIFRNHQRFKLTMDKIKQEFDAFENVVREQRDLITRKTDQLKTLPAGSNEYRALEEELAELHTKLRLEIARKQKDRVEQEAKVYFNAYKEIEWHVSKFADRYGIDLVVRFNSDEMDAGKPESILQGINRTVVFHRSLNITNHILDELNRGTPPQEVSKNTGPQIPQRPAPR